MPDSALGCDWIIEPKTDEQRTCVMSWMIYSTGNLAGILKKLESSNIKDANGDESNPYQIQQYMQVKSFLHQQLELMRQTFEFFNKGEKIYFDLEARGHIEVGKRFNLTIKIDRTFLDVG